MIRIAWKNLLGSRFRSLAVFLCAALVAGLALSATLVVRGAEASLRANLQRMGAEIMVLPWGTMTDKIGGIRLMSAAIDGWMPPAYMEKVAAVEGVAEVTPQLYLAALEDSPYSPYPQTYLVAFDPASDFVLRPWLRGGRLDGLAEGEAIAGAHIAIPGEGLSLYGMALNVVDRLEATETSLDSTLFVSFETADRLVAASQSMGDAAIETMPGGISAVMVRLEMGSEPHDVAVRILEQVPGVVPLETPNLFQAERRQMIGVLRTLLGLLGSVWALTLVFMALVFSTAVNERRFEVGVMRAIGFRSGTIVKILLLEGATLAAAGGLAGLGAALLGFAVFGERAARAFQLPLQIPSPLGLLSLAAAGLALALASVMLSALVPAWRISHEEAAVTMRV